MPGIVFINRDTTADQHVFPALDFDPDFPNIYCVTFFCQHLKVCPTKKADTMCPSAIHKKKKCGLLFKQIYKSRISFKFFTDDS